MQITTMGVGVFLLNCVLNFIYTDFLTRYLTPKYKRNYVYVLLCFYIVLIIGEQLYQLQMFRMFLCIFLYVVIACIFYKDNMKEKLVAVMLMVGANVIVEGFIVYTMITFQRIDSTDITSLFTIIDNSVYCILLTLVYKYLVLIQEHIRPLQQSKYSTFLLLLLCTQMFLSIYAAASIMSGIHRQLFLLSFLFLSVILNILLFIIYFNMIRKSKIVMFVTLLEKEYTEQLNLYLQDKEQEEEIAYLRHDIMNTITEKHR